MMLAKILCCQAWWIYREASSKTPKLVCGWVSCFQNDARGSFSFGNDLSRRRQEDSKTMSHEIYFSISLYIISKLFFISLYTKREALAFRLLRPVHVTLFASMIARSRWLEGRSSINWQFFFGKIAALFLNMVGFCIWIQSDMAMFSNSDFICPI